MAGLQRVSHCSQKRTLLLIYSLLKIKQTSQKPVGKRLWMDDTIHFYEKSYVWRKENTTFQHKNFTSPVKHEGGSIMDWACFIAPVS